MLQYINSRSSLQLANQASADRINADFDERLLLAHLELKERHYEEYVDALRQFGVGDADLVDETLQNIELMEALKQRLVDEEKAREDEERRMRSEFEERRRRELEMEIAELEVRCCCCSD